MSKTKCQISEFHLMGQFKNFVIKGGDKVKYVAVIVSEREYWIKPPKALRERLKATIRPGSWLEITGERELSLKTGKVKLKANAIALVGSDRSVEMETATPHPPVTPSSKAKILVCQKSSCWKKGGQAVCHTLARGLCDRGLEENVEIKLTGCLKKCKKGPNVVMMPDKAHYCNVDPQQVSNLLEQHFPSVARVS